MVEQESEIPDKTELSDVMNTFYRALAVAQSNIFMYLKDAKDEEDLISRAQEITDQLAAFKYDPGEPQCSVGTVWNPITQRCE